MSTPNRRSTDSFYVKPQVNERPLRRATDSFGDGVVVTKNGNFVNKPIVSGSLSKAEGYFVTTSGFDRAMVRAYVRNEAK